MTECLKKIYMAYLRYQLYDVDYYLRRIRMTECLKNIYMVYLRYQLLMLTIYYAGSISQNV